MMNGQRDEGPKVGRVGGGAAAAAATAAQTNDDIKVQLEQTISQLSTSTAKRLLNEIFNNKAGIAEPTKAAAATLQAGARAPSRQKAKPKTIAPAHKASAVVSKLPKRKTLATDCDAKLKKQTAKGNVPQQDMKYANVSAYSRLRPKPISDANWKKKSTVLMPNLTTITAETADKLLKEKKKALKTSQPSAESDSQSSRRPFANAAKLQKRRPAGQWGQLGTEIDARAKKSKASQRDWAASRKRTQNTNAQRTRTTAAEQQATSKLLHLIDGFAGQLAEIPSWFQANRNGFYKYIEKYQKEHPQCTPSKCYADSVEAWASLMNSQRSQYTGLQYKGREDAADTGSRAIDNLL